MYSSRKMSEWTYSAPDYYLFAVIITSTAQIIKPFGHQPQGACISIPIAAGGSEVADPCIAEGRNA
jgi:hypothetical protein